MIGPKKPSEIRRELEAAFAREGKTPIAWLDERIRELERAGASAADTAVLQSLRRFIAAGKRSKAAPRRRLKARR